MSKSEASKSAEKFLKEQAAIMKKYGDAPKLSGQGYRAALHDAAKTFQAISSSRDARASA